MNRDERLKIPTLRLGAIKLHKISLTNIFGVPRVGYDIVTDTNSYLLWEDKSKILLENKDKVILEQNKKRVWRTAR